MNLVGLISSTCENLLYLVVPIFRRAIFSRVLLAVPNIFLFLGGLLFLVGLFIAGMVTMKDDKW